ncbi:hypothetical protein GCM10022214_24500 [Actinomadura miaoliensis]|uniref:Uncharacterized protein n=1 Tax=Actinomadura miaoliensis TaxID=430685 RepID=A0ABP7VK89_9ACTN
MLQQVTTLLVHEPPLGWDHVQVDYRGMGDYIEAGALLRMTNGALCGAPLPEKVQNLLTRLRAGTYRPRAPSSAASCSSWVRCHVAEAETAPQSAGGLCRDGSDRDVADTSRAGGLPGRGRHRTAGMRLGNAVHQCRAPATTLMPGVRRPSIRTGPRRAPHPYGGAHSHHWRAR